jgi:Family of unknown function (DUF6370)
VWLAAVVIGCGRPAGIPVAEQVVQAGCGTCVFEMPEAAGCFWAVEIGGQHYPVSGVHPPDDMLIAHEAGGMCTGARPARVAGEIRPDGRFLATRFELLPLPSDALPPAHAHEHR